MRILPKHQNLNEVDMKEIKGKFVYPYGEIAVAMEELDYDYLDSCNPLVIIKGRLLSADLIEKEKSESAKYIPTRILQSGDRVIVFWGDGSKTIVKCSTETPNNIYSAFTAALAIKVYGNNSRVNRIIDRKHEAVQKVNGKQVVVENYEARKAYRKWLKKREKEISENEKTPD